MLLFPILDFSLPRKRILQPIHCHGTCRYSLKAKSSVHPFVGPEPCFGLWDVSGPETHQVPVGASQWLLDHLSLPLPSAMNTVCAKQGLLLQTGFCSKKAHGARPSHLFLLMGYVSQMSRCVVVTYWVFLDKILWLKNMVKYGLCTS